MRFLSERDYLVQGEAIDVETLGTAGAGRLPLAGQSSSSCAICGRAHEAGASPILNMLLEAAGQEPTGSNAQNTFTITRNPVEALTFDNGGNVPTVWRGAPVLLTYSFLEVNPSATDYPGFAPFLEQHRAATRLAFEEWAKVSGLSFVEVPASVGGAIKIGMHNFNGTSISWAAGYASLPSTNERGPSMNYILMMKRETYEPNPASMDPGTGGFQVLLHEIGHNLGLRHPHDSSVRLAEDLDTTLVSVMSYTWSHLVRQVGTGDIAAVQLLYGTNENEQTDGITWTLDRNTWTFNFQGSSAAERIIGTNLSDTIRGSGGADTLVGGAGADRIIGSEETAHYAGGYGATGEIDVLDMSAYRTGVTVTIGSSSSTFVVTPTGRSAQTATDFEHIIGTAYDDSFLARAWVTGLTYAGGAGNDTYGYYFWMNTTGLNIVENPNEGTDTIVLMEDQFGVNFTMADNIENARVGTDVTRMIMTGNALGNEFRGGTSNDVVNGQGGNDTFIGNGGFDTFDGGTGDDTVIVNFTATGARTSILEGRRIVAGPSSIFSVLELNGVENIRYSDGTTALVSNLANTLTSVAAYRWGIEWTPGTFTFSTNVSGSTRQGLSFIGSSNRDWVYLDDLNNTLTLTSIEIVTGGAGHDTLVMNGTSNRITVTSVESIRGNTSSDFVEMGNSGNTITLQGIETLLGGSNTDVVTLAGTGSTITIAAIETLVGGANTDVVALGNRGNTITITGVETITGGVNTDVVTLTSNALTVTVSGIESLVGTSGTDTIRLADGGTSVGIVGIESVVGGSGNDTVILAGAHTDWSWTTTNNQTVATRGTQTVTLTNVERLGFSDRAILLTPESWQTRASSLGTRTGRTVTQVAITPTEDPVRGTLSSRIQVNGQDIQGVTPTLKKGWKLATVLDVNGDGTDELFFFGVDQSNAGNSGFGATWTLNDQGVAVDPKVHIQMRLPGWEVAGAASLNATRGDEVIWQHTQTGIKAFWSDTNGDGTFDLGNAITGMRADTNERIVGVVDFDKDGINDLLVFNDQTKRMTVAHLRHEAGGGIGVRDTREFDSYTAFTTAATAAGVRHALFSIV